jgi:hypothetical protein
MRKCALTCGFVNQLDKGITLPASRGAEAALRGVFRVGLCLSLALSLALNPINITTANAYPLNRSQTDWALVAMNHLGDLTEAQCWVELIWRESRFNPAAKNGSHYGLAQMRNDNVRTLTPRQQVRWHMRYLDHRYNGSACKALKHMNKKGWH